MRIYLLPLSTRQALIYCKNVTPKAPQKLSYVDRATKKAADTWAKWETAEQGWQKKLTLYGNRALQRIPYQEWGLKSFLPLTQTVESEELAAGKKFPVYYPANIMSHDDVPKVMSRLAKERKQLHYRRFVWSLIGLPVSLPFGIIPIIPNIPFFYLAFRAWSHWRALKGSDHLDFILDHRLFTATSTPDMEAIYRKTAPGLLHSYSFVTRSQVDEGNDLEEQILLTASSHTLVARTLGTPELSGEVERAVWQISQRLDTEKAAKTDLERKQASERDTEKDEKQ